MLSYSMQKYGLYIIFWMDELVPPHVISHPLAVHSRLDVSSTTPWGTKDEGLVSDYLESFTTVPLMSSSTLKVSGVCAPLFGPLPVGTPA